MIKSCNGFDITKEHSDIGIEYLRKTFFKKNGDPRKAAFDDLTDHDISVLRNFKSLSLLGLTLVDLTITLLITILTNALRLSIELLLKMETGLIT